MLVLGCSEVAVAWGPNHLNFGNRANCTSSVIAISRDCGSVESKRSSIPQTSQAHELGHSPVIWSRVHSRFGIGILPWRFSAQSSETDRLIFLDIKAACAVGSATGGLVRVTTSRRHITGDGRDPHHIEILVEGGKTTGVLSNFWNVNVLVQGGLDWSTYVLWTLRLFICPGRCF